MFTDSHGNERRIVDCTFFNDELDILEIRLAEHDKFCDYFVIVEGNRTFANKYKPYYFDLSNPRIMNIWMKYKDKIYYHRISEYPSFESWGMENFSRRSTGIGIENFKSRGLINDNDFVLLSDVDEIVDHKCMSGVSIFEDELVYQWNFNQSFRYFYFNCVAVNEPWSAPAMVRVRDYNDPHKVRHHNFEHSVCFIKNGGWHFSYMGGPESIVNKLESTAHRELDRPELKDISEIYSKIKNKKDPLDRKDYIFEYIEDDNYPQFVLDNLDRFGKYFSPERK
jgi:beta-1,4-mannosyl-glycoprotein beta-1,4-N-acetylglucosaminyltransferase